MVCVDRCSWRYELNLQQQSPRGEQALPLREVMHRIHLVSAFQSKRIHLAKSEYVFVHLLPIENQLKLSDQCKDLESQKATQARFLEWHHGQLRPWLAP